jgi:hypothetical protein
MPTPIRVMLSIVVALVALVVVVVIEGGEADAPMRWFAAALAVAMEGAIWLFPEARKGAD